MAYTAGIHVFAQQASDGSVPASILMLRQQRLLLMSIRACRCLWLMEDRCLSHQHISGELLLPDTPAMGKNTTVEHMGQQTSVYPCNGSQDRPISSWSQSTAGQVSGRAGRPEDADELAPDG